MTKYQALVKTRTLWLYLARRPECQSKSEAYTALGLTTDTSACPCCEYATRWTCYGVRVHCEFCPLINTWPGGCIEPGSLYLRWMTAATAKQRSAAAWAIATAAHNQLKKEPPYGQIRSTSEDSDTMELYSNTSEV